jgi:hypothetical protein
MEYYKSYQESMKIKRKELDDEEKVFENINKLIHDDEKLDERELMLIQEAKDRIEADRKLIEEANERRAQIKERTKANQMIANQSKDRQLKIYKEMDDIFFDMMAANSPADDSLE